MITNWRSMGQIQPTKLSNQAHGCIPKWTLIHVIFISLYVRVQLPNNWWPLLWYVHGTHTVPICAITAEPERPEPWLLQTPSHLHPYEETFVRGWTLCGSWFVELILFPYDTPHREKKKQKHSFAAHSRYCLWHSDIFCLLTLLIPPLWEAKVLLRVKVAHQKRVGYIFVVGISFFLFFFFEGVKKIIDHSKQCLRDKHTSLVEAFSEPGITGLENASVFIKGNAVSTDQQALHPSARNCSK